MHFATDNGKFYLSRDYRSATGSEPSLSIESYDSAVVRSMTRRGENRFIAPKQFDPSVSTELHGFDTPARFLSQSNPLFLQRMLGFNENLDYGAEEDSISGSCGMHSPFEMSEVFEGRDCLVLGNCHTRYFLDPDKG